MEVVKISGIEIRKLTKSFLVDGRNLPVLRGVDLSLSAEDITILLGQSGCGKTTLLRIVAGLEKADGGSVEQNGIARLGIVFQEPRLMPWLTVERNIAFGRSPGETDRNELARLVQLAGLEGFERAYPAQLSGGMQQRTAIARALAMNPSYLLMDEPFAALDYFTRARLQQSLLEICRTEKKGMLFITHHIDEALILGSRIVVMKQGICAKQYDLRNLPYPRDLTGETVNRLKREILNDINESKEENGC